MSRYTVLCYADAYVVSSAEVEADSPEAAAELAWNQPERYVWKDLGAQRFDARCYLTLDAAGFEIESTRVGRVY